MQPFPRFSYCMDTCLAKKVGSENIFFVNCEGFAIFEYSV